MVKENGRILMFLTLFQDRNKIVEWLKPRIKYFTSVEFGDSMYKDQLEKIISDSGMEIKSMDLFGKDINPLVKIFKIYIVEVTAKGNKIEKKKDLDSQKK